MVPARMVASTRTIHSVASLSKLSLCVSRGIDIPTHDTWRHDRPQITLHRYQRVTKGSWTARDEFRHIDYTSHFIYTFLDLVRGTSVPGLMAHRDFLLPLLRNKQRAERVSAERAAYKLILVSEGYGAFASRTPGIFPSAPEWMVSVVDASRVIMERTEAIFTAAGARIVYGNSDSMIVDMPRADAMRCAVEASYGPHKFVMDAHAYHAARFFSVNEYILYDCVESPQEMVLKGRLLTSGTVPHVVQLAAQYFFRQPYDALGNIFGLLIRFVESHSRRDGLTREDLWTSRAADRGRSFTQVGLKRVYTIAGHELRLVRLSSEGIDIVELLAPYENVFRKWWALCGQSVGQR